MQQLGLLLNCCEQQQLPRWFSFVNSVAILASRIAAPSTCREHDIQRVDCRVPCAWQRNLASGFSALTGACARMGLCQRLGLPWCCASSGSRTCTSSSCAVLPVVTPRPAALQTEEPSLMCDPSDPGRPGLTGLCQGERPASGKTQLRRRSPSCALARAGLLEASSVIGEPGPETIHMKLLNPDPPFKWSSRDPGCLAGTAHAGLLTSRRCRSRRHRSDIWSMH